MTTFEPEKLIPVIRVARKLEACDSEQQLRVLQQLPRLFNAHGLMSVLTDIVFSGLCNRNSREKITSSLYDDIHEVLPVDSELNLKDSIYESQLTELPEDDNEDKQSTNQKKEKLPLTLLRVPTDLQSNVFHFLHLEDLIRVQKVCRSLCIVARNPASLYSLEINKWIRFPQYRRFGAECYSRPISLSIVSQSYRLNLMGNTKWGQQVNELAVIGSAAAKAFGNLGQFENLTKCALECETDVLFNGQISSYHSLKELTFNKMTLNDKVFDHIRTFRHLEVLSITNCMEATLDPSKMENTNPIVMPQLKELSFSCRNFYRSYKWFQRILIGSHPEIVNLETMYWNSNQDTSFFSKSDAAVQAIQAVKVLNIKDHSMMGLIAWLSPLFLRAKMEVCNMERVTINLCLNSVLFKLSSIIPFLACASQSELDLREKRCTLSKCTTSRMVQEICNATYGTLNEIFIDTEIRILECDIYDHIEELVNEIYGLMDSPRSNSDFEILLNLMRQRAHDAEKWMMQWLTFNENRMRQIGLRKLDIKFKCSLAATQIRLKDACLETMRKKRRILAVMRKTVDVLMTERAAAWMEIDKRCRYKFRKYVHPEYIVTLSLQA